MSCGTELWFGCVAFLACGRKLRKVQLFKCQHQPIKLRLCKYSSTGDGCVRVQTHKHTHTSTPKHTHTHSSVLQWCESTYTHTHKHTHKIGRVAGWRALTAVW